MHNTGRYTEETVTRWWKWYEDILEETRALRFPWEEVVKVDIKSIAKQMRSKWVNRFGDPQKEETKAAIAATVAYLDNNNLSLRKKP